MSVVTRSVTIQVRVVPVIKEASKQVLHRIGLNMSEAVELFLRRVIVDERLPFEVVALDTLGLVDPMTHGATRADLEGQDKFDETFTTRSRSENSDRSKKEFKSFSRVARPVVFRLKK